MAKSGTPAPAFDAAETLKALNIPFTRQTDGTLAVPGDIDLSGRSLTALPDLSDVTVEGHFHCQHNRLTSLAGAPGRVGKDFWCFENLLTSLEGAPAEVGEGFYCSNNRLTSLAGAPRAVGGSFYCQANQIVSLEGAPETVGASFYCRGTPVVSLEHAPLRFTALIATPGVYKSWDEVPDELAPETKRRAKAVSGTGR